MKRFLLLVTLALFSAPFLSASAAPKASVNPGFDPKAVALLDQSAAAYKKLKSFSAQISILLKDKKTNAKGNGTVAFLRPGRAKIRVTMEGETDVQQSDGSKVYFQIHPRKFESSNSKGDAAIQTVFFGQLAFGSIKTPLSLVLTYLVVGDNPAKDKDRNWKKVTLLPNNGVALQAVREDGETLQLRIYIDSKDSLVRRVETKIGGKEQGVEIATLTNIQTNPKFAPGAFTFKLPRGAKVAPQNFGDSNR